jgi:hypothetical protein
MPTNQSSATAYENVVTKSDLRERLHALRFAYVKLNRAAMDVERAILLLQPVSDERRTVLQAIRDDAMCQRNLIWKEIECLDGEINTEVHRLNNGVYDNA